MIGGDETRRCTSRAPASRSSETILRVVVPRTIESSTTITRLPSSTCGSGLNLSRRPTSRSSWFGWMKVRPDVAVLDQPVAERQPRGARVADRGGRAAVGHGDHDVGLDGRLDGEPLAHALARRVQRLAAHARVGPGEVDVLEDAERLAAATGLDGLLDVHAVRVADHELARLELAHDGGADDVERGRLGGEHRVARRGRRARAGGCRRGRGSRSRRRARAAPPRTRRGCATSSRSSPRAGCRDARRSARR